MEDLEKVVVVSPDTVTIAASVPPASAARKKVIRTRAEQRDYDAKRQARSRIKKKQAQEAVICKFDSAEVTALKYVPEILAERGIPTPCVQQAILRFGEATAQLLNIPCTNKYYWLYGSQSQLARIAGEEAPGPGGEDYPEGELLNRKELAALFEHCALARVITGKQMSFEEWLAARLRARTDLWFLCVDIAGKGLVEATHREMVEFFVHKDPRHLSQILSEKGDFSQEDLKTALAKQDVQHDRLLLFPRSMYKSTINILDCVQWQLVFHDLRIAVQTSTLQLGRAFLSELKAYFTVRSLLKPSNLQALFPETTMVGTEKGTETTFRNPAARLGLKEPSVWNISADSDSVGYHNDVLVDDDYVSAINSNTPESRDKLAEKFFLSGETLDRPWGYRTTIGTRYSGGESPDIYGRLLDLDEQTGGLKTLVRGAWSVLPHAALKKITELEESDVILLFPLGPNGEEGKGSYKVLRRKLLADVRTFRQQQLNEAVDDDDEGKFSLNFDRDLLNKSVVQAGQVPQGEVYISIDVAYNPQSRFSDKTALAVVRVHTNENGEKAMCVLHVESGRMRLSETAQQAVILTKRYSPKTVVIEKAPIYDLFESELRRVSQKFQVSVPLFWAPIDQQKHAKFMRLKGLEVLLFQGRLTFASGTYVEALFNELERLVNERKSSHTRQDDSADALSQIQRFFCSALTPADGESAEKKMLEEQIEEAKRKAYYFHYFGGDSKTKSELIVQQQEQENSSPLFRGQGHALLRKH